ncbi:MAG: DUF6884 domain-containing protein [Nanoarchaeota archaeon]
MCSEFHSAKYGFLTPQTIINPYDFSVKNMSKKEKLEWGQWVARNINNINPSKIDFYTGIEYFANVTPFLDCKNFYYPWKGLGIGQRLSFLNKSI